VGWIDTYNASEVAQKLVPGERVLVDGKRATFLLISDGKELYEFSLYPEGAATVDLADLDRRVQRLEKEWEEDPEPDWFKEGEDFLRWLRLAGWMRGRGEGTPREVVDRAFNIIEGLLGEVRKHRKARDKFCINRCHAGSEEECERLCPLHGLGEKK
jgi:hypothetical protein